MGRESIVFVPFEPAKRSGKDNLIVCFLDPATCVYCDLWQRFGLRAVVSVKTDDLLVEVNFGIRYRGRRNVCEDLLVCTSHKRIFWDNSISQQHTTCGNP